MILGRQHSESMQSALPASSVGMLVGRGCCSRFTPLQSAIWIPQPPLVYPPSGARSPALARRVQISGQMSRYGDNPSPSDIGGSGLCIQTCTPETYSYTRTTLCIPNTYKTKATHGLGVVTMDGGLRLRRRRLRRLGLLGLRVVLPVVPDTVELEETG